MSDKLMINGRKYVSASIAASMTKYTQDYVGQLCRGNKVNATRIGRNWYVDIDSLLSHKEQGENSTVSIKIGNPSNKNTQNDVLEEPAVAEKVKPEEILEKEELGEISGPSPERVVKMHVANYTSDKSPLLPPLINKISAKERIENTPVIPQNKEVKAELSGDTQTPEILSEPPVSLFSRMRSILWPTKERFALGLILIVMFSAMFALSSANIQYTALDVVSSVGSTIFEKNTIIATTEQGMKIFEGYALGINDFVNNTIYNFLYTP